MNGILYGVGVGPGDPEQLTLKAIRTIENCDIIAVPGNNKTKIRSYDIVKQIIDNLDDKPCLLLSMPMTEDEQILKKSHETESKKIIDALREGKNIAFLTIGDPSLYSTYIYMKQIIEAQGLVTQIISGIPSFCLASAKLNIALGLHREQIHIIPVSNKSDDFMKLSGTKILMKVSSAYDWVKNLIKEKKCESYLIENAGLADEKVYIGIDNFPDKIGYLSLIIIK